MKERRGPLAVANRRDQELLLSLLRNAREEKGLSQSQLARLLKKPQSFVSKYEGGARRLDLLELKAVCDTLGMDVVEFVRRFAAQVSVHGSRSPKRANSQS
jgi:transcriptional regulator with XRE-family HTH domain